MKVLIFTGEILNEKLWVDVLDAGADGIILKTGELLTRRDVSAVMDGKQLVFNEPILEKIVERFKAAVSGQLSLSLRRLWSVLKLPSADSSSSRRLS